MDERRTGENGNHLDEERLGLASDAAEELGADDRRHLELCAVCRAEVARLKQVATLVGELGAAYREQAPPEWPAVSAVEALAREPVPTRPWLERLGDALGIRARSLATAVALGVGLVLAAAVVLVAVRPPERTAGKAPPVAAARDAGPLAVPPSPAVPVPAPTVAEGAPPGTTGPVAPPVPPAHEPASSSVVAMAAGRDVSYVMMNVPYEGGTAAVIWLSALPSSGG
jgi:hypothetical protein